jgi:CheY-like chemotaxis protein
MTTYRIVIIDDQHEVRHMLASGLRMLGPQFDVLGVPSAEEGFLLALRGAVDLLVVDVRLPGISGLELVEKVHLRNPAMKVILITGVEDEDIRQRVMEANVDAYFFKPIVFGCFGIEGEGELPALVDDEERVVPDQEVRQPTISAESLTERLYSLRTELDAHAALILDREGRILAQAGEYPQLFSAPSALPSLIAIWNAGAKFSHVIGMDLPDNWMSFSGADQRLSITPAGQRYILVVVERDPRARGDWLHIIRSAQADLTPILEAIAVPTSETRADESVELREGISEAELGDVEGLLQRLDALKLEEDVDSFWDQAVAGDEYWAADSGGALSYEQARKLGLTPERD